MKKKAWKIVIISVVIIAVSAYYMSSWMPLVPNAYRHTLRWWEEKTRPTPEERREKRRAYIERLPQPKLTGKEVAELLRKEQIIKTQELYDMASWYAYFGNRDVIKQILANRRFEMKIKLPKERDGHSTSIDYIITGKYLGPFWNTDIENLIQQQEMHRYAANNDTDPYFIHCILGGGVTFKTDEYRDFYGQLLFYDDILAYLRIYANYKDWPEIKSRCERILIEYPCAWRDFSTIYEVLKIAEEKGPEPAYELYMQRYRSNYQKFSTIIMDYKDREKEYKYECIIRGWSCENIRGEAIVYDVDSNEAVIGIRDIEKIISVLRDGENITNLCHVIPENIMTIPLKRAEVIELKYRVNVCPHWWVHYHGKR